MKRSIGTPNFAVKYVPIVALLISAAIFTVPTGNKDIADTMTTLEKFHLANRPSHARNALQSTPQWKIYEPPRVDEF